MDSRISSTNAGAKGVLVMNAEDLLSKLVKLNQEAHGLRVVFRTLDRDFDVSELEIENDQLVIHSLEPIDYD